MEWAEVIEHPSLRNLPFKIETNRYGQIVMSPASNRHGVFQMQIGIRISQLRKGGCQQSECAVVTDDGVKVADVAWYSTEFWRGHEFEAAFTAAPELCVEVLSPSNSRAEIDEKMRLYFQHGACEVWICDEAGVMRFVNRTGELPRSELFPEFPLRVEID
jgi:Uma2 family endonuclease